MTKPRFPRNDHVDLRFIALRLIRDGRNEDAAYIRTIVRTDLAELGYLHKDKIIVQPGQKPVEGWHVYEAVLRWCHNALQDNMIAGADSSGLVVRNSTDG